MILMSEFCIVYIHIYLLELLFFNSFDGLLLCFFTQDVYGVMKDFAGVLKSMFLVYGEHTLQWDL